MPDTNWTGPFRANDIWVLDANNVNIARVHGPGMETARAAAIAHALNRLPEAEAEVERLRAALALYDDALTEAEAIFGGEYGDHYGPMCEMAFSARAARKGQSDD
jgi:predicted metallo-beta-lactamase superfamily hydrolase